MIANSPSIPTPSAPTHELPITLQHGSDVPTVPAVPTLPAVPTHELKISLQDGAAFPPKPMPILIVGETVRYFSPDGKVTIRFPDISPFRLDDQKATEVYGLEIHTLVRDTVNRPQGIIAECFITLPSGQMVGWSDDYPDAGGEIHIGKPGGGPPGP